jgi:hypothetical protein
MSVQPIKKSNILCTPMNTIGKSKTKKKQSFLFEKITDF